MIGMVNAKKYVLQSGLSLWESSPSVGIPAQASWASGVGIASS